MWKDKVNISRLGQHKGIKTEGLQPLGWGEPKTELMMKGGGKKGRESA